MLSVLRSAGRTEAPTWALVVLIYGGWLALTWWWHALPLAVRIAAGAWVCAWHMSLQHELIHGHPTRSVRLNMLLAMPPLSLWLPFPIYRAQHLQHHRSPTITDPLEDPESTYMSAADWAKAGPARRFLHVACNTALGRLAIGPVRAAVLFWAGQARLVGRAGAPWRAWIAHAGAVGALGAWAFGVCRIAPLSYLACVVYPGTALIMLRSLAEHRAAARPEDRTAVVEHAPILGLLYLHNNLHALHHAHPQIPWYALPRHWRRMGGTLLAGTEAPLYRNYADVVARYAWRPHHPGPIPVFPAARCVVEMTQPAKSAGRAKLPMPLPDAPVPASQP